MEKREFLTIQKFYRRWFGSMEQGKVEQFLNLLDDEFYLKSPGQPPTTSRSDLRADLESFHRAYTESVEWNIEDLRVFEGYAVVRVAESVTLSEKGGDTTTRLEGVHLALLRKNGEGNWRLQTDVSSFNHPLPQ